MDTPNHKFPDADGLLGGLINLTHVYTGQQQETKILTGLGRETCLGYMQKIGKPWTKPFPGWEPRKLPVWPTLFVGKMLLADRINPQERLTEQEIYWMVRDELPPDWQVRVRFGKKG